MSTDNLEGFRHERIDSDQKAVLEAEKYLEETTSPEILSLIRTGIDIQRFIANEPAGRYLIKRITEDLQRSMDALLSAEDLHSVSARKAHFDSRVSRQLVIYINDILAEARQAEAQLEQEDNHE